MSYRSRHSVGPYGDDNSGLNNIDEVYGTDHLNLNLNEPYAVDDDDSVRSNSNRSEQRAMNHHPLSRNNSNISSNNNNNKINDNTDNLLINYDDGETLVTSNTRWFRKKNKSIYMMIGAAVLLFVVILPVSIVVPRNKKERSNTASSLSSGENGGSGTKNGPTLPKPEVDEAIISTNKEKFLGSILVDHYVKLNVDNWMVSAEDVSTPQGKALFYVTSQKEFATLSDPLKIQRYALAVFYYSTFYQFHDFMDASELSDWTSSQGWITDLNECQWEGVVCNGNKLVTGILLSGHALSGTLPIELGMLDALTELDFTNNYIHMEGSDLDLFLHLKSLKELRMEDNFLVSTTGLPTQFSALTSLEVLQLSYNLLQGEMVGSIFTPLQSLQHLEIESNYLSGSIPSEVGLLPNLVYLYARRNILEFSLASLIPANTYPTIFSLWLDNNIVSGNIPTTIGLLTGLGSLSITNGTLTGPIPTELGLLTDLKRVWLYDNELTGPIPTELTALTQVEVLELHGNQLTGTMPSEICEAVSNSDYQYRTLTADCDSLSCDCCTLCY